MKLTMVVEVPKGAFVKRATDGAIDFISALPCPFNYGSIPDRPAEDGEPQDALHIGPRLHSGEEKTSTLRGVVRFIDGPYADDKFILKDSALTVADRLKIEVFFRTYALMKSVLRRNKRARYLGFIPR